MSKRNFWLFFLVGGLVFSLGRMTFAQQASPSRHMAAQEQQQQEQQNDQKTFTGKIEQSQGKFVLQDSSGATYRLDDQDQAKKYDGQNVKVVGTLDARSMTIHVAAIEPA